MINLSTTKFLKILFSFIGIAYLLTFIYSVFSFLQKSTAFEMGQGLGYNLGFVSYYLVLIAISFTTFFLINFMVRKFRLGNK